MNLDIMSLMAASAAVTDTSTAGTNTPADASGLAGGLPESSQFAEILQNLKDAYEGDLAVETLRDPEALAALSGRQAAVSGDAAGEAGTALGPDLHGIVLPLDGNSLPVNPAVNTIATGLAPPAQGQPATGFAQLAANLPATQTGWFSASGQGATPVPTQPLTATSPTGDALPAAVQPLLPADPLASRVASAGKADVPVPALIETSQSTTAQASDLAALARTLSQIAGGQSPESGAGTQTLSATGLIVDSAADASALRAHANPLPSTAGRPTLETATTPLTPLNLAQPGWDKAMGQRLVMMASRGIDSAELRLDPPQLGSVQVKLALQGDQTQLIMQVANPAAREALEAALPRLRELLGEQGLQLEHAQVSERNAGEQRQSSSDQSAPDWDTDGPASSAEDQSVVTNVETLTLGPGRINERV